MDPAPAAALRLRQVDGCGLIDTFHAWHLGNETRNVVWLVGFSSLMGTGMTIATIVFI